MITTTIAINSFITECTVHYKASNNTSIETY